MSIIFNGHYRVKNRTWITEALRLHFDENLSRIEAGRRLGIPKTTVCELFARFKNAGLVWPLPVSVDARSLDKRLYRQASRKSSVLPVVPPAAAETPAVHRRPRRPNFPREFKIALVEKSMMPGVSVAQLARENDINDNLLFNWRRLYQLGLLGTPANTPALFPVTLTAAERPVSALPPLRKRLPAADWFCPPVRCVSAGHSRRNFCRCLSGKCREVSGDLPSCRRTYLAGRRRDRHA